MRPCTDKRALNDDATGAKAANWADIKTHCSSDVTWGVNWRVAVRLPGAKEWEGKMASSSSPCHKVSTCVRTETKEWKSIYRKSTSRRPLNWQCPALLIKALHRRHTWLANQRLRSTQSSIIGAVMQRGGTWLEESSVEFIDLKRRRNWSSQDSPAKKWLI